MYIKRLVYDHRKLAASLLFVAAGASLAPAQVGLGLSPMRLEQKVNPGAQSAGALSLTNDSDEEVRFRTEILDFNIDKEAIPQFEKDIPAESQFSCRHWLTFNPMEATVPPKSHLLVRYTLRVPAELSPRTYHCAGGFISLPPIRKQPGAGVGMNAAVQMIAAFYFTVGEPAPAGELKEIAVQKIDDPKTSGLRAIIRVENNGFTNLRGTGSVEVLNASGQAVETLDFPTTVILPKRSQLLPLVLTRKLADDDYTLRVRVNIGTGEIQEATFGFRPPRVP